MGYRSRRHAGRLRVAACQERLADAERSARERLGGALPYALETRIARLETRLARTASPDLSRTEVLRDFTPLAQAIDTAVADLEALTSGERPREGIDEAFVRWVRDAFSWRPARPDKKLRAAELSAMLRRLDPDATIGSRRDGLSLEARLVAHRSPLYFLGQLDTEVIGLLATPVPRQARCFHLRPYRWWRRLRGLTPATLGHDQLDGRFAIEDDGGDSSPFRGGAEDLSEDLVDELRDAFAALCLFDEPTLHIEGAAATLSWTYDVAYEPLAAAARVLVALRRVLAPPPPPPPSRPRTGPTPMMLPVVPARLRSRRP
jgi:hypothetical protein